MSSTIVKQKLKELKKQKTFDEGFIDILSDSNDSDADGTAIAKAVIQLISERYAESKENKAKRLQRDS